MPRVERLILGLSLCVLPGFVAVIPVFAQSTVVQEVTIESKMTRPQAQAIIQELAVSTYGIGRPDFERRLADLNEWIETGTSKGWLSAEQAGAFKAEANRLTDFLVKNSLPNGDLSTAANNTLEKQLNILSADLSSTMTRNVEVAGMQQAM